VNARLPDELLSANARAQRKYRENPENREKAAIRNRIHYALKRGWLVKTACICGSTTVEAHHYAGYDLAHALDVIWLCKRHHEDVHHGTWTAEDAA
jgi:hypothetical protein